MKSYTSLHLQSFSKGIKLYFDNKKRYVNLGGSFERTLDLHGDELISITVTAATVKNIIAGE